MEDPIWGMCHTLSEVTQTQECLRLPLRPPSLARSARLAQSPDSARQFWLGMSCTNILQTSGFCQTGPGHTDDWSRANT